MSAAKGVGQRNTIATVINVGVSALLSLLLQPVIVKHLPPGSLALQSIGNNFMNYMGLITITLTASLARNVLHSMVKGDTNAASEYYSTAFFTLTGFLLVVLLAGMPFALNIGNFLSISDALRDQASSYFVIILVCFCLIEFRSIAQVGLFVSDRLDLQKYISLAETTIRVAVTYGLIYYVGSKFIFLGYGVLAAMFLTLIVSMIFSRTLERGYKLQTSLFQKSKLHEMTKIGGWTMVDQLGVLLLYQSDVLIVNQYSTHTNADIYSAAAMLAYMVRQLAGSISSSFTPGFVRLYAKGDLTAMAESVTNRVRKIGMIIALPAGIIVGAGPTLFTLWLRKPEFAAAWPVAAIIAASALVNCSMMPVFSIWGAMNLPRIPAIANVGAGILAIATSILVMKFTTFGIVGVAASVSGWLMARNGLFSVWYASRLLHYPAVRFFRELLPPICAFAALVLATYLIVDLGQYTALWHLGLAVLPLAMVYAIYLKRTLT